MTKSETFTSTKIALWSIPSTILIIDPNQSDPINLPKLLILIGCTIGALAFYCLERLQISFEKDSKKFFRSPDALYLSLLLVVFFVGIISTPNWVRAIFGAIGRNNGLAYYFCVVVLILILIRSEVNKTSLNYCIRLLAITSLFFIAYSSLQFLNMDPLPWANDYNQIIGTLGNPNFSSSLLGIFSVFWMFRAANSGKTRFLFARHLMLIISIFSAFLAWKTESLQGVLITFIGYLLLIYAKVYRHLRYGLIKLALNSLLLASALFTSLSFLGVGPLGARLEQYTFLLRFEYIKIGLRAMLDNPLLGVGVDGYNAAFRQYRDLNFVQQYGIDIYTDNAHSTPIQIGACFGVLAFVIYCVLQIRILHKALALVFRIGETSGEIKLLSITWILIFIQSLISIEVIGLGVMNWVLGALILVSGSQAQVLKKNPPKTGRILGGSNEPVWLGAAKIIIGCFSLIPYLYVAREDTRWLQLSRLEIKDQAAVELAQQQLKKLTPLTLLEPRKVSSVAPKMIQANLGGELNLAMSKLIAKNPEDVIAIELAAILYHNTGRLDQEYDSRLRLRSLDPLNYRLELALAELFASQKKIVELKRSVSRMEAIAPQNSTEMSRARELLRVFQP